MREKGTVDLTPGPWRVAAHDSSEVYAQNGDVYVGSTASPANAVLLAASPQLLQLVHRLSAFPCTCREESGRCPSCQASDVLAAIAQAVAAINASHCGAETTTLEVTDG